jgi:glycogen operon protein
MPAYEFNENMGMDNGKVNYWGYTDADYLMPKVAYSAKKDAKSAIHEFKTMVKELHKNGIEVCMEFYFSKNITPNYIVDCFRHWVINYHIDGIHCNMNDDIRGAISSDPYLTDTKIISYGFDSDDFSNKKHLGECNRVFMNVARKFLKGDEGQVADMAFRIRYNKPYAQAINYIANNDTFTMMDMVSYGKKHNEGNKEYNRDGIEDNYSWNCGFEGETKRKSVVALRQRQLKNAMGLLMLSQGAPMIYAGDEFGNSCGGNNNPYCQDNDVSYLDWRLINKNNEYFEFVKKIIAFRKEHSILHLDKPMMLKDYYSLGMPDMSYHSERTWSLDNDILSRHFGIMLYGRYCKLCGKESEENIFMAFNMHWEEQKIGLPTAGKGKEWKQVLSTDDSYEIIIEDGRSKLARTITVPPRSVVVLISYEVKKNEITKLLSS